MKPELIIFGAGKKAKLNYDWALAAGYHILCFADNDPDKWKMKVSGLPVCRPDVLKTFQGTIVIPDLYQSQIGVQLDAMKCQSRRITVKQLKKEAVVNRSSIVDFSNVKIGREISFLLDSYFTGTNWGGIESYSCIVANELYEQGIRTQVMCGMNKTFENYTSHYQYFAAKDELEMVRKMAKEIARFLPCVFISHASIAWHAACMVKTAFPNQLKLVLVSHVDKRELYEKYQFLVDQTDQIVCISKKIQKTFHEQYGIRSDMLLYRPNPIFIPTQIQRRKKHDDTLKIGYAARLIREQKRVNLLPELIDLCMEKNLNVEFHIAGEGECEELLLHYIAERNLQEKVYMHGFIPPDRMPEFWKEQDVYLNISEYEGMSLAMLEAMVHGVVPVVTDVSGVKDLIEDGKNGFIVPVNDWIDCAKGIEIVDKNRDLLYRAGNYNIDFTRRTCNVNDYVKWIRKTFHF